MCRLNRNTLAKCLGETLILLDVGVIAALVLVWACVVVIQLAKLLLMLR